MNYTLQDLFAVLRATLVFSLLLYFPGYVLGHALDLMGFRRRSLSARAAWAVGLSFAVVPFLLVTVPLPAMVWGVGFCGTAAVGVWLMRRGAGLVRGDRAVLVLLVLAAVFVALELVDVNWSGKLYVNVAALDQQYRVAFTQALSRSLTQPMNPLYHPGHAVALRYYYFWYGLCAEVAMLARVGPRAALIASSIWTMIGLVALVAICLRHFFAVTTGLRRQVLVAGCLLGVTGADLLPVTANLLLGEPYAGDPEWWSTDQVTSWLDSVLWVPHHTAALLCCMVAFVLLWQLRQGLGRRAEASHVVVAALTMASAFGLSVYVTIGFAVLLLCWVVWEGKRRVVAAVMASGGLALVLLVPFVLKLLRAPSGTQAGHAVGAGHLLGFGVRKMIDSSLISGLPVFAHVNLQHATLVDQAVRLVLLVPGYGVELGFAALVLWLGWRGRKRLDEARRTALFLTVCGLILVSFVRSAVIENNDFGYRAALLPCFLLLLLGSDVVLGLSRERRGIRWLAGGLLVLGAAGTLFQAISLRGYVPWKEGSAVGKTLLDRRQTLERAARLLPEGAILQANGTDSQRFDQVANMLFTGRAMATDAAEDCGAVFGGDPMDCPALRRDLRQIYGSAQDGAQAMAVCHRWGIDALVVVRGDSAWDDRGSWAWLLPEIAKGGDTRVVLCRGQQR